MQIPCCFDFEPIPRGRCVSVLRVAFRLLHSPGQLLSHDTVFRQVLRCAAISVSVISSMVFVFGIVLFRFSFCASSQTVQLLTAKPKPTAVITVDCMLSARSRQEQPCQPSLSGCVCLK